jgi:hypothetical protein
MAPAKKGFNKLDLTSATLNPEESKEATANTANAMTMASNPDANDTILLSFMLVIAFLDILIDRAPMIAKTTGMTIQIDAAATIKNPPRDMGILALITALRSTITAKSNIAPAAPPFIAGITLAHTTHHSLPIYWVCSFNSAIVVGSSEGISINPINQWHPPIFEL